LLAGLQHHDVRALAWMIGSPSLFEPSDPAWDGALLDDDWAAKELARMADLLFALDADPASLERCLGDPREPEPLGHCFERLVLFWQRLRSDVRTATRGLVVRSGGRTLGEFDVVALRQDGVIETLEVTVKFYLNLNPGLGIDGIIGPRAFDRMRDKHAKMASRQRLLGATAEGRRAIADWLERDCGWSGDSDALVIENLALSRGFVFHPPGCELFPSALSMHHARGRWQTERDPLPPGQWRTLAGREWLAPYRGPLATRDWPIDPRMPRMVAAVGGSEGDLRERERRFVLRPDSGLFAAAGLSREPVEASR